MTREEFLEKIFNNQNTSVVGSFVSSIKEKEGIDSIELTTILECSGVMVGDFLA